VYAFHASLQTLARQLPKLRRAQGIQKGLGFDPLARMLELDTGEAAFRYALDGDFFEAKGKLKVEVGPKLEIRVG
jgi:hypothetical protein